MHGGRGNKILSVSNRRMMYLDFYMVFRIKAMHGVKHAALRVDTNAFCDTKCLMPIESYSL